MTEACADEWGEAEEEAWCLKVRPQVVTYLQRQKIVHGRVGDLPAWHIAPIVSIWAIESSSWPGAVGWWVICGDLPTDYCSSQGCRHPRLALQRIVEHWRTSLESYKPGDTTIGSTGIPATLADLLTTRAQIFLEWAEDDGLWPDYVYG